MAGCTTMLMSKSTRRLTPTSTTAIGCARKRLQTSSPGLDSLSLNQGPKHSIEALDYQDVELKIIQQEGYDAHDFNIFDDRASLLWRKPYIDGAVRELTSGDDRSPDQLRRAVEQIMLAANDKKADVRTSVHAGHVNHTNVRMNVAIDQTDDLLTDLRRNPEKYEVQ